MSGLRYNSGKSKTIGDGLVVDKASLDPALYGGSLIYHTDKQLYYSNGSIWILVQPANSQFSLTGNNSTYAYGKQEGQLSVNSAIFSTNAEFSYTANSSLYANNSTYAYGKKESQLSVANSVYSVNSITSNNTTYAYGKQESQLSVANAVYTVLANNATYAYGKQESQLSVSAANNSSYLLGRTWASPSVIGNTNASNGTFTYLNVLNDLTVQGNTTFVNTNILTTTNTFIILNNGQASPFNDIGVVLSRYTSASPSNYNIVMYWEESTKNFIIGKAGVNISQTTSDLTNNIVSLLSADENGVITIDGQLSANLATIKSLTVNTVVANGTIGSANQFLASNGAGGTYWYTLNQYLPVSRDNTSSIKYYLPMSNSASANWTNAVISDSRLSFTPSTGTLTANQGAFTDVLISGNSYISKLFANGTVGGDGQVLVSNGAGMYWENSLTVAPKAGYGLSSNATHYQVKANTGIIANSFGTFVNSSYIASITANNATYAYGKQESQLSVNAAVYATNAQFSYLSDDSNHLEGFTWEAPAVIGGITANDAFFANTTLNTAQIGTLYANGGIGSYGQILASNGTTVFWTSTLPSGVSLPLSQNNTSTATWYFPMSNNISGSWANAAVADGSLSFIPSTGVLRIATANVAKAIIANGVIHSIFANGSSGSAGQVLTSNGSSIYWTGSTITTYDLIGVANTDPDVGILRLTSSSQANDDVLFVGRGTTVVSSNSSTIIIATQDQYKGTVTSITSGNGLVGAPITTSGTLAVGAGAGISVNQDDVAVNAKDGLWANASGLWVNNDYIRTLSLIAVVNNAIYLNGKLEADLNANSALYANNSNYLGGKDAAYWTSLALGNTTANYTWSGLHTFNRSIFMGNNVSSYIEWNDAGLSAPSATSSWGAGTKLALWQKTGTSDVGYGIGLEANAIWYSANSTLSSHKWYANTNNIMVANSSGLFVNGQIFGTVTSVVTSANNAAYAYGKQEFQLSVANSVNSNNSTYAYGKQEGQLSVANAVYADVAGSVLGTILNANNASYAYGRQQSQLNANSAVYLNGKQESQLVVANAVYADVAGSVLGTILNANNSSYAYGRQQSQLNANSATYLNGKQESQLYVANAVFATSAGSVLGGQVSGTVLTANSATYLGNKQESQLYVANAVFATTAGNVLGGRVLYANNADYAYGKQEFQIGANSSIYANAAIYLNGKQESQLSVANAVYAQLAASVEGGTVIGTVTNANNSSYAYGRQQSQLNANSATYLNGKQESQLYVANAVFATSAGSILGGQVSGTVLLANSASYLGNKQESQLYVANAVFATLANNVLGTVLNANNSSYLNGKQESQLGANSATYLNGKQESQLYVANAVFADLAGSVLGGQVSGTVLLANSASYLGNKQESQLYVANAVFATTANNSNYAYGRQQSQLNANSANSATYLNGKQESQLYVANAVFATTANNALRFNGKQESQLSVSNSDQLQNSTWDAPFGIGSTTANTGAFTTLTATGNVAFSGGILSMANTTSNKIVFDNVGIGAPTVGSYSAGTKIVMYDSINATTTSYAMGIESNHIWNSVPIAGGYKWYANTTNIMLANTTGLYVNGSIFGTFAGNSLNANNSTYLNTKSESQLSVAQAANSALLNSQNSAYYLNASNLATGTVPTARLGSGTADATTFLRGDQTYAEPTITAITNNITWNGGYNILVAADSSFDLSSGGVWGVWDTGNANYTIKSGWQTQVEIGRAGSRGLAVIGPTNVTGLITATGNITAYYSDQRLKTDIKPLTNALDKVMSISGVTFKSNDVAAQYGYTDTKTQVGVIAQEIEAVLPEIVVPAPFDIGKDDEGNNYSISGENYKTVQYEKLVPLLIEAIKELKAELDEVKKSK